MSTATQELQNAELTQLVALLQDHQARRHDVVAKANALSYRDGRLVLTDTLDGTDLSIDTEYTVNRIAQEHLADRLGIPTRYWDRMAAEAVGLLDTNVNHWLAQDDRSFMVRTLTPTEGEATGMCRAVLSDKYRVMDDLDVLMATLDGLRRAEVDPRSLAISSDRTLRRMYVRITAPEVAVDASNLVEGYRDPRSGQHGRDYPMVWAGLVVSNSEVGHGSFSITPRITFQVCSNGMTMTKDVERSVHLGSRLEQGVVAWSEDTQQKNLELVASVTRDAVATFLSRQYVQGVVDRLAELNGQRLEEPSRAVEVVCTRMKYTQEQQAAILDAFIGGGDTTPLGLAQAVTNVAQGTDPEQRAELEGQAWRVMELASRL
jgi:hypothetical protein